MIFYGWFPFKLEYKGNKVNSVKINGIPKDDVYYSTTDQSSSDKKLVSTDGVPNGDKFYLWINEKDLEGNQNVTVEFVQNFTYKEINKNYFFLFYQ